ncbi:Rrf2 family transcriptional regulator [Chelativorans sp. Marseille-P2723]|uniref:RrF2 family transcriptional regulator n=1 Tax=Chelativorans sp. Marseille-P2723 TaxID=2709133 RepID=UPI001FEE133F|nr:Rrf2 family transcriptional regulator [Chelativorans sp. Marseille-P2723]
MTLHTDYAMRMLIMLGAHNREPVTVQQVADTYGLSRNHLLKVARKLRQMGIIDTTRGRAGGIQLAKEPADINIGTIVRATEDDLALVECMKTGGRCLLSPSCRLKGIVREALDAYLAVFDKYSLADLIQNKDMLGLLLHKEGV